MRIFVVLQGEQSEGGNVEGVFKTRARARKYVESRWATFQAVHSDDLDDGIERWENSGCDYVEIQPHEVQ